jgi:hypothetical protein
MKNTYPLGQMTVPETEALDINRQDYKKVFELTKTYKKSFVKIEIKQYKNDYFYGLHYLFTAANLYHRHGFAALRKWGIFTSLSECREAAINEFNKSAETEKEKEIVKKLNVSFCRQGELFS